MKTKLQNVVVWVPTGESLEAGISCNRHKGKKSGRIGGGDGIDFGT